MAKSKRKKLRPIHPVGRYAIGEEIASGGMASIHLGRLLGPVGFSRTVAFKKLHPQLAKDPEFTAMFLDEARVAARVQHPNVVQTLDVVAQDGELFLVMEYIAGESLSNLLRVMQERGERIPIRIAVTVIADALQGLHAAHEATNEHGEPLHIVHRDVSPQNVLVGKDGIARVLDFGIAKASGRLHTTREGQVKGKLAFMAPEQVRGGPVTRQADIFAAASVLWLMLTGQMLFDADNDGQLLFQVLEEPILPPSARAPGIPPDLDAVVMKGLERNPAKRFATARDMAVALERTLGTVTPRQVAAWLEDVAGDRLAHRARQLSEVEILSTIPGALDTTTDGAIPAPLSPMTPVGPAGATPSESLPPSLLALSERRMKWWRPALLIAAGLAIGGSFAAGWVMRRPAEDGGAPGTESSAAAPAAPAGAATGAPGADPEAEPAATPEPAPAPSADALPGPSGASPAGPPTTRPRASGAAPARPRASDRSLFVRE